MAVAGLLGAGNRPSWLERFSGPGLLVGAGFHAAGLTVLALETGKLPVYTPGASMATISLLLVVGLLVIRRVPRMEALTPVIVPLVVVLLALAQLLPNALRPSPLPLSFSLGFLLLQSLLRFFCCWVTELESKGPISGLHQVQCVRVSKVTDLDALHSRQHHPRA